MSDIDLLSAFCSIESEANQVEDRQKKMETPTETSPKKVIHQTGIDGDSRFRNFSDEFIAFGNMMCAKLNDIVEPIKTSNDQL